MKRPVLRYHGGKWRLAPWIIGNFPTHRVYVEPYGGGGSVLMRRPRSYAEVYNDLDGELVNLFKVVRDNGAELKEAIRLTPFARAEFIDSYQPSNDPLEQARRTVIRSFMGFGSNSHNKLTGFRNNSNLSGTTPAHDWANYPAALELIIERLRGVVIENKDAISLIQQMDGVDTLFYVDPPYVMSTRDKGHDYRHEMSDDDHERLADALNNVNGYVVLSGYSNQIYSARYKNWECLERKSFADGAKERVECLWLNPACSAALINERVQQTLV